MSKPIHKNYKKNKQVFWSINFMKKYFKLARKDQQTHFIVANN